VSSIALVLLSTFPIMGSAGELLDGQILHINCNGNVNDQSNLKHPIENEGVTFVGGDRLKRQNMACFFDGSDYLKIANNPAFKLSNLTIAAWVSVYGTDTEKTRAIVSNYDGSGEAKHYGLNMSKGVAGVFYDDGIKLNGARDTDGTSLTDEEWHHVTAVFEGGVNTKLYVDGEPRRQTSGTMSASITPTGDLYIGRGGSHEGMEERWRGSLDEIRIINRVLSEDEINLLSAIIDLPTGETFIPTDPTGENGDAPFFFNLKKDEEGAIEPFKVTPNSDGGFSINNASSNTTRSGVRGSSETTLVIKDGEMTLIDEALPGVVATVNILGDLEITDADTPDLKLILRRNSDQFTFQSISNPSVVIKVHADGGLEIIDESQPEIKAIRDEYGHIHIKDEETNTVAVIDGNGNTVITNPDFPNIEASFNVYDTEDSYTLKNTLTNECIEVPADSNVRKSVRGLFSSIDKVFKKGISKITCFLRCGVGKVISNVGSKVGSVFGTVGSVVKSASKFGGFASKLIGGISKHSGLISGVLGIGSTIINAIFGNKQKKIIKQLEGQVRSLQGQVHTLQAALNVKDEEIKELNTRIDNQDVQITALQGQVDNLQAEIEEKDIKINELEARINTQDGEISALQDQVDTLRAEIEEKDEKIKELEARIDDQSTRIDKQDEIIAELRAIITQQATVITQQAEAITALKDTVEQQKQIIESQAATIESLDQRIADLEDRTRSGNDGAEVIPDGDDISGGRIGIRDRTSNECRNIITPATCQVYGVQDEGINNSIFFVYNPVDQTVKQIGETCQGCDLEAMAIHPVTDEIYLGSGDNAVGHPNGHLFKLDANTGALRSVGVTGFEDISGLIFDDYGILWGWAKDQGLVTLNTETGQGHLELPSSIRLADLSWDSNYQTLYGVVGKELWSYDPNNGNANKLCENLPRKTEAIKALPTSVSPAGIVWIGSHNNNKTELQAYEIATCQPQKDLNLSIGYNDVEGISMPTAACQ
jgi:peptidoglycan hydrolase CwlO-like protein